MRREIIVLGFSLIVLILISGCASPQNAVTTGSKSQNSALGDTNFKTTSASSYTSPTICNLYSLDPNRFQKFLPAVSGWTRRYGKDEKYYFVRDPGSHNSLTEIYSTNPEDISNSNFVQIYFFDYGSCVTPSTDVYAHLNAILDSNGKIDNS